jgi:hypothetical protein
MNNKFGDCCNCPPLSDGRFLTRYDDRIELDLEIMKKNNIGNSLELRKYLIDNASNLIDSNIKNIEKSNKCNYNKPADQPYGAINNGYYVGETLSNPADTMYPFNTLSDASNSFSPSTSMNQFGNLPVGSVNLTNK